MIGGYIVIVCEQIPKGTAQMKRYNGRTRTYFKSKRLQETEDFYLNKLKSYAPVEPIQGAVSLSIDFDYFTPKKKERGNWKVTRPDLDNLVKLLIDCMTKLGFWVDDSQIGRLSVRKQYSETDQAQITIHWREAVE